METATQPERCWDKTEKLLKGEPLAPAPQETPAQGQQVSVAQLATAYLVLNSAVTYGAYWPEEITDWAQGLMRGEKRVGIELVREATLPVNRDPAFQKLVEALEALEPYLATEAEMLDYASLNEGRASGFDTASMKAREALRLARQGEGETT